MDRMDYLKRDSFYTGVNEGNVNSERLIQMLNVQDDVLVMEEKGIYSIEKFLMARRLMYWQAYLHKTSLVAELTLTKTLQRAKELLNKGIAIECSRPLKYFMKHKITLENISTTDLNSFSQLDDYDIISALKEWQYHYDFILSSLSKMIINRDLSKVKLNNEKFPTEVLEEMTIRFAKEHNITQQEAKYFIFKGKIKNQAYSKNAEPIRILKKDRSIEDVVEASDQLNLKALSKPVTKYFICFPKLLEEI
jgi:HD superfamily phosphohydrolase